MTLVERLRARAKTWVGSLPGSESTGANLDNEAADALEALEKERNRANSFLMRLDTAEKHLTHYAYGRTVDEQVGEIARGMIRDYRKCLSSAATLKDDA